MPKKAALEQFHRENISAVADRLFSDNGIEKTTMDDIARGAEYSKATLYVYFKSKDEIFHYIVLKGMKLLHEQFKKALSDNENTLDAYYAMCNTLAGYCDQHPLYFQSILETIASDIDSREQSQILEEIYQAGEILNHDVEMLIQRGIGQGVLREDLSYVPTGFVHWSALSGIISLANKKQDYIRQRMGMSKTEFMRFGFEMMLQSIIKPNIPVKSEGSKKCLK